MKYIFISILACVLFTFSCSDSKIVKQPIDSVVKDQNLMKEPTFTILLHDMEIKNKGFHKEYLHKYNIIKTPASISVSKSDSRQKIIKYKLKTLLHGNGC